jgi:hypothetical protein
VSNNVLADQSTNPANGFIRYLDPTAFALPALGTFGNTSRNIIRGPSTKNLDLSLTRAFAMTNSQNIEVRLDAFNAFNWYELGNPNVGFGSATFGQISTVAVPPRVLQLAVKYTF